MLFSLNPETLINVFHLLEIGRYDFFFLVRFGLKSCISTEVLSASDVECSWTVGPGEFATNPQKGTAKLTKRLDDGKLKSSGEAETIFTHNPSFLVSVVFGSYLQRLLALGT